MFFALYALLLLSQVAAAGPSSNPAIEGVEPVLSVGLEPFPPLINEDGTGLSVTWLQAVAAEAGYRLEVHLMPYSRAQMALRTGQVDLVGHVPLGRETQSFYQGARELDWGIGTKLDVFALKPTNLAAEKLPGLRIGTPYGNTGFVSPLTGIPLSQFSEASLDQLVLMLQRGRIDAVIFERASVMTELQRTPLRETPVYYRLVEKIPAGFAVRRGDDELLARLNGATARLSHERIFKPYAAFLHMPDSGRVPPLVSAIGPGGEAVSDASQPDRAGDQL